MNSEKITSEKFLEMFEEKLQNRLKEMNIKKDSPDYYLALSSFQKIYIEILAGKIPTEMSEAMHFIDIRYFIIGKSENIKAEIYGKPEGFLSRDAADFCLQILKDASGLDLELTAKIVYK